MKCWRRRECPFNSNNSWKFMKCEQDEYSVEQCRIDNEKDFPPEDKDTKK